MSKSLLFDLILNISLLVLIANLFTKSRVVREKLLNKKGDLWSKVFLAITFGAFCIFSTYMSIPLDGVLVNTRVIGALAGGIIGGPFVGIGAGLIGGVHRYLFGVNGLTSLACALSTFIAGYIGSVFSPNFQRGKWNEVELVILTACAEVIEMLMILLLSQPFDLALNVVKVIALPLILLNSIGMLIFMATFKSVFVEDDQKSANNLSLALSIAEKSLPYLRKGLSDKENIEKVVSIILSSNICSGVIITDHQQILNRGQIDLNLKLDLLKELPISARQAMERRELVIVKGQENYSVLKDIYQDYIVIAAPLIKMDKPVGCLLVIVKQLWLNLEASTTFVKGIATLFSTQLELSEFDNQKILRQKAELSALQSQINPHFLYNSLNTLSCIIRENPTRARELLMTMATYFRKTLELDKNMISLKEEIAYVNSYLIIEKARFEDKLKVNFDIPEDVNFLVPPLILQPIVENAVKYGVDSAGQRRINIVVRGISDGVSIIVSDSGPGFPVAILEDIQKGIYPDKHIGLSNVHRRIKSIYGEDGDFLITSSPEGSQVELIMRSHKIIL